MATRDRGPKLVGNPTVRRFQVHAPDRAKAILVARDLAWDQGLWVVGDADVTQVRAHADSREFVVTLACVEQK